MPRTLYFFPFMDKTIDSGFIGVISAKTALHGIAPTLARKKFRYLWKMGNISSTFAHYVGNTDRIYVMGHCGPGDHCLSTEVTTGSHLCYADDLADHFFKHGLLKTSLVHIRIHACNSGTSGGTARSFAEELKEEMRQRGYNHVDCPGIPKWDGLLFHLPRG